MIKKLSSFCKQGRLWECFSWKALPRGRILALLGPSGCGKSSLLRAVAGLEEIAAGTIVWDGADVVGVPVHKRGFGLMFQDGQLFPFRDMAKNDYRFLSPHGHCQRFRL